MFTPTDRPVWLLDFDGVVNIITSRVNTRQWDDHGQRIIDHPFGALTRKGRPRQLPLRWSDTVVRTIADAVEAGIDVRWLTTWRQATDHLPDLICGLPEIGYLDETLLPEDVVSQLDPRERMESGAWKAAVAAEYVPDGAPLLWTDDSIWLHRLTRQWRAARRGPTVLIRPAEHEGLLRRDIATITDFIDTYAVNPPVRSYAP